MAAVTASVLTFAAAAWRQIEVPVPAAKANSGTSASPRTIAGGPFEASGVAHVPGTSQVLFVDDGRHREIFSMEISPDGGQRGVAQSIELGADVTDLEGITFDGRKFYVVGSQSKGSGFDGDGLVRFTFDPKTRRASDVERIQGLKSWLAANVPELRGTEGRVGDRVLNIEGLAWDPRGRRLLLGLRVPIIDGAALVVPIKLIDSAGTFSRENLRVDGATIRVQLNGAGIRALEYDETTGTFRLIAGAAANRESRDFRVVEWDGESASPLRDLASFARRLKPEGITRLSLPGGSRTVLVFDVGRFVVID